MVGCGQSAAALAFAALAAGAFVVDGVSVFVEFDAAAPAAAGHHVAWLGDQLLAQLLEHLVQPLVLLRAHELQNRVVLQRQLLSLLEVHLLLLLPQIGLVAHYRYLNVLRRLLQQLFNPDVL